MSEITSAQARAFLDELAAVCERHGLSLSHQDEHGSFLVAAYQPYLAKWLRDARLVVNERTGTTVEVFDGND